MEQNSLDNLPSLKSGSSSDELSVEKPDEVLDIIKKQFADVGLPLGLIYQTLKDGLSATKVHYSSIDGYKTEEIDYSTRHKYLVTSLELLKHLKNNIPPSQVNNNTKIEYTYVWDNSKNNSQNSIRPTAIPAREFGE